VREGDTVTNVEFDEEGETDVEELLQAESEHDDIGEREEQTAASAHNKFKNKIFRWILKRPRYQHETASTLLLKYLVQNDKEGQAEPTSC
jgi:hypothetical protein